MFLDLYVIFVAFAILIIALYFLDTKCNGYCCAILEEEGENKNDNHTKMIKSEVPVIQFTRNIATKNNPAAVPQPVLTVLKPLFAGLTAMKIKHNPIFNLSKLGTELKNNILRYGNYFTLVTISGEKGTKQEIYYSIRLAQLVTKPGALLVVDNLNNNPNVMQAWHAAITQNIITWKSKKTFFYRSTNNSWVKGIYQKIPEKSSFSNIMVDIIYDYLGIDQAVHDIQYYITSKEREDEIRQAYEYDKKFKVLNTTSVFHAAILKCLYPNIIISITNMDYEDAIYEKGCEFLNKYILI